MLRNQHEELQSMMEVLIEQNKTITAQNKAFAHMMGEMREKYRKKLETLMLLFLFGKKNKPDSDFLFPPQFSNVIEAFEQMNHSGPGMYMLPHENKKRKPNSNRLPMLTNREQHSFSSDGERSEVASQFDKDEKDDIFRVLNHSKSQEKVEDIQREEEKL